MNTKLGCVRLRSFAPTVLCILAVFGSMLSWSADDNPAPGKKSALVGDRLIAEYFRSETDRVEANCLTDIQTLDDWKKKRPTYLRELQEMLGLDPMPERTDLNANITSVETQEDVVVEQIHFQSRPHLYVTGNVYRPKNVTGRLPAILYVCGHGPVKLDGISYGNKVAYQHHGGWFARNGYVCLTIDTLQLGEIEGIHHGTYRHSMFWWLDRGYTPAGVEAWNCIRALDYLQSRPDVDPDRIGATGRSGGGAYSWWIAALDERIKAVVPVAGITDLRNHVVDGCVEGHCDCMYFVNTYQWDYPLLAAMVAPRPLLISNTDSDGIFPLDGVVRTFEKARRIYTLHGVRDKIGLNIGAGPHKDTQDLQVNAFRWLNKHLKNDQSLVDKVAVPLFKQQQLKVFASLPKDELNTTIHESFVAAAENPSIPVNPTEWNSRRDAWLKALGQKSFRAWPARAPLLNVETISQTVQDGVRIRELEFTSQGPIRLRLYVVSSELERPEFVTLEVCDQSSWQNVSQLISNGVAGAETRRSLLKRMGQNKESVAFFSPRGIGASAWDSSEKKQVQHQRRFHLLGQTLEGMQTWDVRRAIQTVRGTPELENLPLELRSQNVMAGISLYASLYEADIRALHLTKLPKSHRDGPHFLNVMRYLDLPQALAMAAERSIIHLTGANADDFRYALETARAMNWNDRILLQK